VYNDHPWDPKIMAVVDRWLLFRGEIGSRSLKLDLKMVVVSSSLNVRVYLCNGTDCAESLTGATGD
jgi:hypothetical protein